LWAFSWFGSELFLLILYIVGEYCALVAVGEIASAHEMAMTCFMRGMVMQTCVYRDPITQITAYRMAAVSPQRVGKFSVLFLFIILFL
jgi:hypothetical protein